ASIHRVRAVRTAGIPVRVAGTPPRNHGRVPRSRSLRPRGRLDRRGMKDNQVSAQELMSYTRGRMAQWLQKHQAPAMLPVAYGSKEDFILVTVPPNLPSNEREIEPPGPSAKVNANWARLDDWRKDGAQRKTTRTFRQLELTTARADRLVGGGGPVEVVETDLDARVTRSDAQRKELELQPYPVASVGRSRRAPIPKENEVAT